MARSLWIGAVAALALGIAPAARADSVLTLRLDQLAPRTQFSKPTHAIPKVQTGRIVADNVRAVATLYAVAGYERAGLFAAGDRLLADLATKQVPAVKQLAAGQKIAPSASERTALINFGRDLIKDQFSSIVESSSAQIDAYANLVSSVASVVDQFTSDNVSKNSKRDHVESHALAVSNSGYGAVHYAAARLGDHAHELTHVVQQKSVQKAYGAKDAVDLVAKLSGRSHAVVERELARAEAGAQLTYWLRHVRPTETTAQLKARAKRDDVDKLIARLKKLGDYRASKPRPAAKLPKPTVLCLPPGTTKPEPCAVVSD